MSSAKIKSREVKGKKKVLPKLKAILANPSKTRCPILEDEELNNLKFLLQNAIQESKLEPRFFAKQKGICLGLESSLRKINNQTSSCVFISLSIKPNHIISLIARNAETKDETQPVYAQPKLENFIEDIFGVQALCMVFPKELLAISVNVNKWIEERKKNGKPKNSPEVIKQILKKKNKCNMEKPDMISESKTKLDTVAKAWSGDFISFGNSNKMDNAKDGNEAFDALSEIIDKIPTSSKKDTKISRQIEQMEVDYHEDIPTISKNSVMKEGENLDSDDFLEEYKTLIVHKIKGNPNKNPKKKRKKNKKKNP